MWQCGGIRLKSLFEAFRVHFFYLRFPCMCVVGWPRFLDSSYLVVGPILAVLKFP